MLPNNSMLPPERPETGKNLHEKNGVFWVLSGTASRGYTAKYGLTHFNSLIPNRALTLRHIKMQPTNLQCEYVKDETC